MRVCVTEGPLWDRLLSEIWEVETEYCLTAALVYMNPTAAGERKEREKRGGRREEGAESERGALSN